ncbi:MAG: hypothetical protein COT81_04525 [Candidatus Buchananbacteria bacterium CG10_big_fil_rev_8_21_14_0_10_42_9]|uniref:Uncharacterized protein n=1 Tax=Candidatus Buchananbacteria bacterium CG10_big_fil_rev_8_21_14_0_10_42_9 TaxID=1974526 RepID=A0A2H0W0B1_9BACT|nr:MAG: hypothetical protein COT81_04525 [Candidatus Buchananbacteria bacterium CG10_big_fil_rev_8_21_14_0_10_42_9]
MRVINLFIPYTVPVIFGLSLELLLRFPKHIVIIATTISVIVAVSVWLLNIKKIRPGQTSALSVVPLLVIWATYAFLVFIQGAILRQLIIISATLLLYIYLEQVYVFLYRPAKFQRYSLQNISIYIILIALYGLFSAGFGFIIFFNAPILWFIIPTIFFALTATYHIAWVTEMSFDDSASYLIAVPYILAQAFIAVSFMPTSIFVNAAILSLVFYTTMGVVRNAWLNRLEKKVVRRYSIISLAALFLILVTAKWI